MSETYKVKTIKGNEFFDDIMTYFNQDPEQCSNTIKNKLNLPCDVRCKYMVIPSESYRMGWKYCYIVCPNTQNNEMVNESVINVTKHI